MTGPARRSTRVAKTKQESDSAAVAAKKKPATKKKEAKQPAAKKQDTDGSFLSDDLAAALYRGSCIFL